MRRVENIWTGTQAMENFAPEPFARINSATFGQKLRADFPGELGDFDSLGHAGMILPQPRHRRRIFCEPLVKRQRLAVGIHGQWRAAGRIHTDANDLIGAESFHGFFCRHQRLSNRDFRAANVIRRMLPREVRVARQNHALRAVRVSQDGRGDFRAVGDVDDEGANGIRAVVETDGVTGCHRFVMNELDLSHACYNSRNWNRRTVNEFAGNSC